MKKFFIVLLILFSCLSCSASAQTYAVSVKASTIGLHLEAYRSIGTDFNVHLGGSFFSYAYNQSPDPKEDYSLNADLKLNSFTALVDWMPFESSSFRISGGLSYNNNQPQVTAIPQITKVIGGDVYNKDNLGNLDVTLTFNKIDPYIGIGIGNPTGGESRFGVVFDMGVFYQGKPGVKLHADGLLSPSASPEQEAIVQENIKWFQWYPVVSLGVSYKF
ncbi:MAG: hypothetical protein ACM3S2_21170 [Ignavibacteriales bacterium]